MANTLSFSAGVDDLFEIFLFGKKLLDIQLSADSNSALAAKYSDKQVHFVTVFGAKILGSCQVFKVPFTLILPGDGVPPTGCDSFSDPSEFSMWRIPKGTSLVTISYSSNSVEELVARNVDVPCPCRTETVHPLWDLGEELEKIRKDIEKWIRECRPGDIECVLSKASRKLKQQICGSSSCGDWDVGCRTCHASIDLAKEAIKIWICEQFGFC